MLSADHIRSLPDVFRDIDDPRTRKGRRHSLHSTLALATAATLCGARGYKAIWEWIDDLGQKALARFEVAAPQRCPQAAVPIHHPHHPDECRPGATRPRALQRWHQQHGGDDVALAIDGKTLRNAIDEHGTQVHVMSVVGHDTEDHLHPKKVGLKPGADDETKRTNEIGTVIPLLDQIEDIGGKTLTADALLTQRKLAAYLLERNADYLLTVKNNQPTLRRDIALLFATEAKAQPDFEEPSTIAHGRIEQRAIWTTTALNEHLNFPGVGQVFMIRRARHSKATGKASIETAYGVTSHTPDTANAQNILTLNRGHWCIENTAHHCLDWSWDEDRSRIRTGNGPENTTRLRRFAIGLIKARGLEVAQTLRKLNRNVRCVFDFLKMTANTQPLPNR